MGPINIAVDSAFAQTPFMADRAAEVIMADPTTVLVEVTNDKETRRAVGQFIDSFDTALAIYIMQCPPGYERDSRVRAAWSYAINALSQGPSERLSDNEAELFWKGIFERAVPQVEVPASEMKINEEYPVIPTDIDPREPFEWNPAAMVPFDVESREMPVTTLDCMIAAPRWLQWKTRHDFPIPKPKTQAIVSTPIWSSERLENFRKIPKPVQEGMIATALLIESSKIEGSKILALPFPSETNVRYPSLFLDHDFLLSNDALYLSAGSALSYFISMVPSNLLLDLTASALDALSRTPSDSPKLAPIERTAYRHLMLLSKSDRPQLASSLIVRIIIDCPDASSWHRQLLSKKFIRSLSSGQAQEIVSLVASSFLERLEHQMTSSSNQQIAEGPDISLNRYVKVTTLKFLAQFLENADFVPPGFSVDILSKLFQKASHVDVRVAVLESLLYRLGRCAYDSSNLLAEKLMSALELAIPVLGSLNERQQMQDVDWTEAEKTGNLPEVYDDEDMQYLPPMLEAMLRATTSWSTPSDILRRGFIRRIVLPVIEKSMEESARWVKIFTLKHMPVGQSIHTPIFPVRPGILEGLVESCPEGTPKYILDLYQQFVLTNILPPAGLVQLNNKINDDIELRNSNEGQYWLSLYGRGVEVSTVEIVNMLTKPWKPSMVSDGFQVSHVQELVFEQAEALLQVTDESFGRWDDFTARLRPPFSWWYQSDQDRAAWSANGRPVILRIIKRIDALRTPAWQRDPNRQPAVLPPTFRLRLWTLEYHQLYQSSDACATFAQQIISVLRETIDLGLSGHARLDEIRSALSQCLPKYGMEVARCLGDMEIEDSTKLQETLLRAELTDGLLRKAQLPQDKDQDHEALRSIKSTLEAWQNCELGVVRMRGIRLGKHLKI